MLSCNSVHTVVSLLHAVLVGLDHFLDHLAADGTGLTAGQVAVVTVLQVDADFPWRPFNILKAGEHTFCESNIDKNHSDYLRLLLL